MTASHRVQEIIECLGLQPHPEGGYYKETYRSAEEIYSPEHESRNLCTSILFLITRGSFSAFHRIDSDELWNYHEGDACIIHILHLDGGYAKVELGPDLRNSQQMQHIVKAGDWFASETSGEYSLAGCVVSPGFDFRYFELAEREKLVHAFPGQSELIQRLTR
jgi:predicted cupin superfamily sugar epimerase